jgi:hypothetical protein
MVGCVADNLTCGITRFLPYPPESIITPDPDPNPDKPAIKPASTVDIYVFDQNTDYLVDIIKVSKDEIDRGHIDVSNLPDGLYTFVAWGDSVGDNSGIFKGVHMTDPGIGRYVEVRKNVTKLSELYMVLTNYIDLGNEIVKPGVDNFEDLYYAKATGVMISGDNISVPLNFVRNANTLDIDIKGVKNLNLPSLSGGSRAAESRTATRPDLTPVTDPVLNVFVLSQNGRFNSENLIDQNAQIVRYEPQSQRYSIDNDVMKVYLKTMRIDVIRHTNSPMLLYIQDANGKDLIKPLDVVKSILQIEDPVTGKLLYETQAAIDRAGEFDIEVEFVKDGPGPGPIDPGNDPDPEEDPKIGVKITINDWVIVYIDPIVDLN